MTKEQVSANVPANEKKGTKAMSATVEVNYTDKIEEAVQMFGAEALLTNAFANWRVTLQANIRSGLKRGETPQQIQERLAGAKMGVASKGTQIDLVQAYLAKFQNATGPEQKKMLAELQKRAANA